LLTAVLALACSTEPGGDTLKWTLNPRFAETTLGGSVPFRIDVQSKSNINSDLEISHTSLPPGITLDLPSQVTSTVSQIDGVFSISPEAELGTYTVDLNVREEGTEFGLAKTFEITVTSGSEEPDFVVEVEPVEATLAVELVTVITYRVRPLNGFTGTVNITLSDLPDDVTIFQGPNPTSLTFAAGDGGKSGTVSFVFTPHAPIPSQVQAMIIVSGQGITHARSFVLNLPGLNLVRGPVR
jgi:hypothetical protein